MGAINSASITRDYPTGPPFCTQCPPLLPPTSAGGWIGTPSNASCLAYFPQGCTPALSSWTAPALMFLYTLWVTTACAALGWACARMGKERGAKKEGEGRRGKEEERRGLVGKEEERRRFGNAEEERKGLLEEEEEARKGFVRESSLLEMGEEEEGKGIMVQYLKESVVEKIALAMVLGNGLVLFGFYLILLVDFYNECQFPSGSVDNACFFGTMRVTGNYENNAEFFFMIWPMMCVYLLILSFGWREMLDWVRMPSDSEKANLARVWLQDELHVLSSGRPSWASRLSRFTEERIRRMRSRIWRALFGKAAGIEALQTGRRSTVQVKTTNKGRRYFVFETIRYSVPGEVRVSLSLASPTIGSIRGLRSANGLDPSVREDEVDRCGPNAVILELPSLARMLGEEFLSPFYVYQFTIYLIWIWWTYWFVGMFLLMIVIGSGSWSVALKRKSLMDVHNLAQHHDGVDVMRNQKRFEYCSDSKDLVCGDVVRPAFSSSSASESSRRREWVVPADLVLTDGSCAVDESGLTGESMPQSKTAISSAQRDSTILVVASDPKLRGSILFAGTKVLDASAECAAVVLAIGSQATRGQLLSQVLFPIKTMFRFDEEFSVAIVLLLCYAAVAFVVAVELQLANGSQSTWPTVLAYGIFTVSQVVSPMLKIALVAGRVAAVNRLKSKGIACVDALRIDIAGKVRIFCFDKTGTLTKEGLNFDSFEPCVLPEMSMPITKVPIVDIAALKACATCHSLANFERQLLGSSVEISMFKSTGWTLSADPNEAISRDGLMRTNVRRRCQFDQETRTMSVVVEETMSSGGSKVPPPLSVYVKGAPESIAKRCIKSTIPKNFLQRAEALAAEGCYVLGLAHRSLSDWSIAKAGSDSTRDELERDLTCLGLLVFRNELKEDATQAIGNLKSGNVRCVMITGDNAPCGCFVARECGLADPTAPMILGVRSPSEEGVVSWSTIYSTRKEDVTHTWENTAGLLAWLSESDRVELACTGEAFDLLRASGELYERKMLFKLRVYARMSPGQKSLAVKSLMEGPDGVVCAMVGDGGNDSGALRTAHVGLSMSSAEASVVAPFNSAGNSVKACVDLIVEGRASLATSLASYKLLVVYGLLFSVVKMASFYYGVLMPLLGYVMIDIVAVVPLTFAMTFSKPLDELGPKRPTSSLLGLQTVSSVAGFYLISVASMALNLIVMTASNGYVKWPSVGSDSAAWWYISDNWEATTIWVSCYLLFISSAIIFSFGSGFRTAVWRNYLLILLWLGLFLFATLLLLLPPSALSVKFHVASEQFNRKGAQNPVWIAFQKSGGSTSPAMSLELRVTIWALSLAAVILIACWERFFVFGEIEKQSKTALRKRVAKCLALCCARGGAMVKTDEEIEDERVHFVC